MPTRTRKQLTAGADRPIKTDSDALLPQQDARTKSVLLSLPREVRQTVLKYVHIP
jgi:hypothetical protein